MNQQDAINFIAEAASKALNKPVEIHLDTDLVEENVLDSLDRMVFILELAEASGVELAQDLDLVEAGLHKVDRLVKYLIESPQAD